MASGEIRRQIDIEAQPLFRHLVADQAQQVFHRLAEAEPGALEDQALGFDLRDVEDVVDDVQEMARRRVDLFQLVA
ncbi:hypothetical protein SDC9_186967 [bioreactor metagenome]|uniref:Uncharacterized protein n=1 Tax=bioreactor metagenome TaxID=1076179 RepID=A0A645HMG1_9ZZZZ